MRVVLAITLVGSALLIACWAPGSEARTSSSAVGKIVFARVGELYVMNADGTGERRLT